MRDLFTNMLALISVAEFTVSNIAIKTDAKNQRESHERQRQFREDRRRGLATSFSYSGVQIKKLMKEFGAVVKQL